MVVNSLNLFLEKLSQSVVYLTYLFATEDHRSHLPMVYRALAFPRDRVDG